MMLLIGISSDLNFYFSSQQLKALPIILLLNMLLKDDMPRLLSGTSALLIMRLNVHVPANFLSQVIFVFLLFLGMVIYTNEVEKRKKKITCNKKRTTT